MMTTTTSNSSCCSKSSPSSSSYCSYADTITELPSPQVFYDKYIQKRRPVVLKGCCNKVTPKLAQAISSLEHLVTVVGYDTLIQVNESDGEAINNNNCVISFSPRHSRIVDMKFGDFVQKLINATGQEETNDSKTSSSSHNNNNNNNKYFYMTTQNLDMNDEGQPNLYTSPITELIHGDNMDSLRPILLGNLIPMTYNLWIGSSNSPSNSKTSSGLHHDYHDNLYCLLQGNKTFRIAPPHSVCELKTKGTLHTLHASGRIVYQEQVEHHEGGNMIRPDGALEKVERIMEVEIIKQNIEARIEAMMNNKDGNVEQRKLLEQELDALDEELLDLEMDHDHHHHENGNKKKKKDDDNNDSDGAGDYHHGVAFGAGYESSDSSNDDDDYYCGDEPDPKRFKKLSQSSNDDDSNNNTNDDGDNATNNDDVDDDDDDDDDDGVPLNFVLEESDNVQFQTLEIKQGDLFYLPAGWFHEVFSQGNHQHDNDDSDDNDKKKKKKNGGKIHIAFNYWMHPPDVDDPTTTPRPPGEMAPTTMATTTTTTTVSFEKPYKSQFWQRDWDSRGAETKMPG